MEVLTFEYATVPVGPGTNFTVTYGDAIPLLELKGKLFQNFIDYLFDI